MGSDTDSGFVKCLDAKAWKTASGLATAYQIGRAESGAALQLLTRVDTAVVSRLGRMVMCLDIDFSLLLILFCIHCFHSAQLAI